MLYSFIYYIIIVNDYNIIIKCVEGYRLIEEVTLYILTP